MTFDILHAIDNIDTQSDYAKNDTMYEVLNVYKKAYSIMEHCEDELAIDDLAIFQEGFFMEADAKKTNNKKDGDDIDVFKERFRPTDLDGKKENILFSILAFIPRLILMILGKISGREKKIRKDAKEFSNQMGKFMGQLMTTSIIFGGGAVLLTQVGSAKLYSTKKRKERNAARADLNKNFNEEVKKLFDALNKEEQNLLNNYIAVKDESAKGNSDGSMNLTTNVIFLSCLMGSDAFKDYAKELKTYVKNATNVLNAISSGIQNGSVDNLESRVTQLKTDAKGLVGKNVYEKLFSGTINGSGEFVVNKEQNAGYTFEEYKKNLNEIYGALEGLKDVLNAYKKQCESLQKKIKDATKPSKKGKKSLEGLFGGGDKKNEIEKKDGGDPLDKTIEAKDSDKYMNWIATISEPICILDNMKSVKTMEHGESGTNEELRFKSGGEAISKMNLFMINYIIDMDSNRFYRVLRIMDNMRKTLQNKIPDVPKKDIPIVDDVTKMAKKAKDKVTNSNAYKKAADSKLVTNAKETYENTKFAEKKKQRKEEKENKRYETYDNNLDIGKALVKPVDERDD